MNFRLDTSDIVSVTNDLSDYINEIVADTAEQLKDGLYEATPKDTGRAANGWEIVVEGEETVVQNEVPYVTYLDNGHSKQAPAGFIDLEIQKVARS